MARRMEVLQVQGVVPSLVVIGEMKLTLAALELNREDGWPRNQYGVNSAPKSWHVEFQEDRAGKSTESTAEDVDFLFPCLTLLDVQVVGMSRRECTEDLVRVRIQKIVDRS
jgi:hypothetical protein